MSQPGGYSGKPVAQKLGIKEAMRVALVGAPDGILETLGELPAGVKLRRGLREGQRCDLVLVFVTERERLARDFPRAASALPADGAVWVAWPKKASGVPTDMTEHVVRELALPRGWVDTKVCAIDATWSGLKLVLRRELRGGVTLLP